MKKITGWKATFNDMMKKHNGYSADGGKVASYATQQMRKEVLLRGMRDLREMGFKFKTVKAFRGLHIERLVQRWEEKGLSPSTIQNRLSIFRTFANWIGKHGMVRSAEYYVKDLDSAKRTYIATKPKTWEKHGVSAQDKIDELRKTSERFADALTLQRAFGLRSKESLLIRPHVADKGNVLIVSHGTKGGRTRFVPIQNQGQRDILDKLKAYIKKGESLVPKEKTYAQFRNQYYYTLNKHGISRKEGITPHGLRHEHLNELYKEATGADSPVSGGQLRQEDKALDSLGRKLVSERAGHSRESISSAYIGGKS